MNEVVNRIISESINKQIGKFPIIALTGPRQSGKTTLLKHLFPGYTYISLENPDNRNFAIEDPNAFLKQYNDKIIFDEVQRVPALFSYLQALVDNSKKMGQFILSGSQNFHLLNNITQTLAGRVALFKLFPFDFSELKKANLMPSNYNETLFKGFYPAIYDRDIDPRIFYTNYIQTYIEKDVTELVNIRDVKTFRTFLKLCAARAGQLLNLSNIANECDISHTTARAWLSILESSYIVFLLQPYHQNFNKRLVKSPKLFFYDSGLLCNLLGLKSANTIQDNRLKGNIFENMIVAEFYKRNYHEYLQHEYSFWQDSNGNEVDLLMDEAGSFTVYEIKSTQTITADLFKNMDRFAKIAAPFKVAKTLIYGGEEDQLRTNYTVYSWKSLKLTDDKG